MCLRSLRLRASRAPCSGDGRAASQAEGRHSAVQQDLHRNGPASQRRPCLTKACCYSTAVTLRDMRLADLFGPALARCDKRAGIACRSSRVESGRCSSTGRTAPTRTRTTARSASQKDPRNSHEKRLMGKCLCVFVCGRYGPYDMMISSGGQQRAIRNFTFGDVYICAGALMMPSRARRRRTSASRQQHHRQQQHRHQHHHQQ